MRVGFYLADQNPHRDRTLGVTAYTAGLLQELQKSSALHLIALTSSSSYAPPAGVVSHRYAIRTDRSLARAAVDNFHPFLPSPEVDLWHYPKGHLPMLSRFRRPTIGTVHDVILQHYADRYPAARSRLAYGYWLAVLKRSIARLDFIVTVSEFSAAAIRSFCERHRLRCPPIRVTYEAAACNRQRLRKLSGVARADVSIGLVASLGRVLSPIAVPADPGLRRRIDNGRPALRSAGSAP